MSSSPMPMMTAEPPALTRLMPSTTAALTPVASKKAEKARPSSSGAPGAQARVAPSSTAVRRRPGTGSVTTTSAAPKAPATWATITPIGPAPATRTASPTLTRALRTAAMPTLRGSRRAPASKDTESGISWAKSSWMRAYWLKQPSTGGVA